MTTKTGAFILIGSLTSAGLALLPFSTALAADGEIDVKATVIATCEIVQSEITLDFGNYNPGNETHTDGSTFFDINCTADTTAHIALDAGGNDTATTRRMVNGEDPTQHLEYALYQDAPGGAPFGDGTTFGGTKAVPVSANTDEVVNVYGRIPAEQPVPTGGYSDTVQISIGF